MNKWLKRFGIAFGGIVALVVLALLVVFGLSERRIRKQYDVQPAPLSVRTDAATVAEGKRLASIRGCTDCHTESLGGKVFIDAMPVFRLVASNLTRGKGGIGATYRDVDFVRAIRHGVKPNGRPVLFMPSHEFNPMTDEDVGALIAYIRSVPAVDSEFPRNSVGPVGRALFLAGQIPLLPAELIDHAAERERPVPKGPTAEYGAYLATGCAGCHGPGYSGGKIPGAPPEIPEVANITPDSATGIGTWTEADFVRALREGRRPNGDTLNSFMPWRATRQMTDEEIRALWLFLRSQPPKSEGNR